MSFANLYYKRTAGTPKACYICYKPSTTVLATLNTTDFIYTCDAHLSDPGFAKLADAADDTKSPKPEISPEEIARVKEEWEVKQKKKLEKEKEKAKEKEKEKEKEKTDGDKGDKDEKEKDQKKEGSKSPKIPGALASGSNTPTTPSSSHQRYILHRDYFAMRQGEHRRRRQATQAKELAPRLPGAPTGEISGSSV
ncbi:VPS4-associated protein 1 [Crucibulum laeve]|uniref:VPS4-associated protein 1 n=1 Tax=Crucibulum laeve TaxID=68775 RepID=A0A5C3MD58_9AGAR|nr:VPS4-associated protein 1 [Crucibulum laeve]